MHETIIDGWRCHVESPEMLEPWFAKFAKGERPEPVKANAVRSVYKIAGCYLKHNHPVNLFDRLRSTLSPKAKREHDVSVALAGRGIPSVKSLGWASMRCNSMLLTEEAAGHVNARDFWFEAAEFDDGRRRKFKDAITAEIKLLISRKISHGDFHLGNLLVSPQGYGMLLIDLYEADVKEKLSAGDIFGLVRILGSMRGEITGEEAAEMIVEAGCTSNAAEAGALWQKVLVAESLMTANLWRKRRHRIFSDGKYVQEAKTGDCRMLVRKSPSGKPLVEEEELAGNTGILEETVLSAENAKKIWEDSFLLAMHRIPSIYPVAMVLFEDNAKVEKAKLLYRNRESRLYKCFFPRDELIKRCAISRIPRELIEQVISR